MTKSYAEELVYAESEDGILHAGVVIRPAAGPTKPVPIVWIHGFTGRFYEPHAVKIGRLLAAQGFVFVAGNNRGHDFGAVLHYKSGESPLGGACWEKLEEAPLDVSGWIGYAVGLGYPKVALLGHSLGGMKVTYYQALRQDPRVAGLIVASGPVWRRKEQGPDPSAQAEEMVAAGRGLDLLPWGSRTGGASTVSAQTFASRVQTGKVLYGTETEPPAVARIECPLFMFLGSNEEWIGTADDLEWARKNARAAARVETTVFEGADHLYTGCEAEVAGAIAGWVDSLG